MATANILIHNVGRKVAERTLHGRKYLVAPVTMIVPGVLNGSKGALYYPPDEIANPSAVDAWNGMPLTAGHPTVDGVPVSARSPGVTEKFRLGNVYKAKITSNGKLRGEAWFDVDACARVEPRVLNALRKGQRIEVSTGLFTTDVPAPRGSVINGRTYTHVARDYRPDHLAVLLDVEGACSVKDGCGVLVENAGRWVTTDDGNHLFLSEDGKTLMTGPKGKKVEGGGKGNAKKSSGSDDEGRYASKHNPEVTYGDKADRDSDDRYFDKEIGKAKKAESKARAKLDTAVKRGPDSPEIRALKSQGAALDTKIAGLKGELAAIQSKKSAPSPEPVKKTISDADWDNAVAGMEKARSEYRAARKAGKKGEARSRLNDARRFRKILIGNRARYDALPQSSTTNSHTETTMSTKFKKSSAVQFLTANCDCWKGKKGAKATLNALPDDVLRSLVAAEEAKAQSALIVNAVKTRLGEKGATLTINQLAEALTDETVDAEFDDLLETEEAESVEEPTENCHATMAKKPAAPIAEDESEDEEMEGEEEAAPAAPFPPKKGKKPMPATNAAATSETKKRLTMNEWRDVAPPEVLEQFDMARRIADGVKADLVRKLVANSAARTKEQKAQLTKFLNAKTMDDLNAMAMLSVNRRAPAEPVAPQAAPIYGYGSPVVNHDADEDAAFDALLTGNARGEEDEIDTEIDPDVLPVVTANVDWKKEKELLARRK